MAYTDNENKERKKQLRKLWPSSNKPIDWKAVYASRREKVLADVKAAYWRDPEKFREMARARRSKNPERAKEIDRRSKNKNRIKRQEQDRERYRISGSEKKRASYIENVDKHREWNRNWAQRRKDLVAAISKRKRARRLGASGTHTLKQWMSRVEYFGWKCWMCDIGLDA